MLLDLLNKRLKNNVSIIKQITFLDRLSKLISKHYNLRQALEFMEFDPQLKEISRKFSALLHNGHPIDHCFRLLAFHPLIVAFIKFSKESSHFQEHLSHCTKLMKMRHQIQNKLSKALRYPLVLLLLSMTLFIVMNYYMLPSMIDTFESLGSKHSLIVFDLLRALFNLALLVICLTFIFFFIIVFYLNRSPVEQRIYLIHKIPIYKNFYCLLISMQMAYQIHALLLSGKNIREALMLLKAQHDLPIIQFFANLILEDLSKGRTLYQSFKDLPLIQDEFKWLIQRSDEQGTLVNDLQQYSQLLLEVIEEKSKRFIVIIQPVVYVIVGVLVITIYALTLFPIYKLIQHI